MPEQRSLTRRAALGLIGTGGLLAITNSYGRSGVDAYRSTDLTVVSDPSAYLGLDGHSTSSATPTFTNNMANSMDVTIDSQEAVEFDVGTDGNWASPPQSFSFDPGQSQEVGLRWNGDCVGAGWATVSADATVTDGGGAPIGSIVFERDWQIPEAGQIELSGFVKSTGNSGKYEFGIENTGCEDVTLVGIGILETTTGADQVAGGDIFVNDDTGQQLVSDPIPIDSSDPSSDTRRDLTPTVSLIQNDTANFEFDRFRQNGNNAKMKNEDVRIRLYLSDGSSTTEKLCDGSCGI